MTNLARLTVFGTLSCTVVTPVLAQQPLLEEIIVTATRREQSLQDVPISVTVLSGTFIQEGGFSDLEDMTAFLPNLSISDGFQGQSMSIRGVGTDTRNEAFEEAVAQFADGVYYGRDSLVLGGLFDLERVEVVRGPQPVFAGQSATAGAINSYSRRPGDSFDGRVMLQYGDDEEASFEAAIGGPVTDTFGIRVAGRYYDLPDAGYTERLTGQKIGAAENKSFRLTTVWEPTDRFDFTFKYEYQDNYQNGTPTEFGRCDLDFATSVANGAFLPGVPALCLMENVLGLVDLDVYNRETHSGGTVDLWDAIDHANANLGTNVVPGSAFGVMQPIPRGLNLVDEYNHPQSRNNEADILVGTLNWQIGRSTLTSRTSRVTIDKEDWLDPDESVFAVFTDQRYEDFEQFAQELTLTSPSDQTFAWMVGLYYQTTDTVLGINVHLPFAPPIPGVIAFSNGGLVTEDADWTSAFFTGTWNITDSFRFNVGARYQESDKHGIYQVGDTVLLAGATTFEPRTFDPTPGAVANVKSDDVLPELGFQWDATDDMMLYVKYAEAFKAGGFVAPPPLLGPPSQFTFLPEEAFGYELGMKGTFFAGSLQLNIALFDTDFENLQQFNFDPFAGFSVRNAAEVNTQGIEIDGRFLVGERWSIGFNGGYNDAVYTRYPDAGCNTIQNIEWINAGNAPGTCVIDASGRRLFGQGEWQTGLHPEVSFTVGEFSARASMNMAWFAGTPSFFVPPPGYPDDPLGSVPGRHRFDLRVSFMAPSEQWEIALYGRDITDEEAWVGGLQSGFFNSTTPGASNTEVHLYGPGGKRFERGARWGVQANYFFGR